MGSSARRGLVHSQPVAHLGALCGSASWRLCVEPLNAGIHRVVNGLPEGIEFNAKAQRRKDADQPGSAPNGAKIRRKTLSGSHLQIGIEFQSCGSLPRPSASCPLSNRSAPFGTPDSQHSIPTTLAHPTRPGTAPDPHRILTVASPWITMLSTVRLRCAYGEARVWPRGQPGRSCLQQADTSSAGPKCPSARVLHGLGALAKPGAQRQTQAGVAGWPDFGISLG
jgi:hypothetical protein